MANARLHTFAYFYQGQSTTWVYITPKTTVKLDFSTPEEGRKFYFLTGWLGDAGIVGKLSIVLDGKEVPFFQGIELWTAIEESPGALASFGPFPFVQEGTYSFDVRITDQRNGQVLARQTVRVDYGRPSPKKLPFLTLVGGIFAVGGLAALLSKRKRSKGRR